MAKDETEIGITGLPIPKKKRSPAKQHEFEKERRKNMGTNVGGEKYKKDVTSGYSRRSMREEVLSYLLDEGFASDEKSAEAIMGAMSEGWRDVILTEKTKKTEVAPAAKTAADRANQQDVVGAAIQANPDAFKRATESEAKRRRKARERNL